MASYIPRSKVDVVAYVSRRNVQKGIMCRDYHIHPNIKKMTPSMAQDELALRLLFEMTFEIIPIDSVFQGGWLDVNLRDVGHTERMRRLWTRAKKAPLCYTWIHKRCCNSEYIYIIQSNIYIIYIVSLISI